MRLIKKSYKGPDGKPRKGRVWVARFHVRGRLHEKTTGTRDRRAAELIGNEFLRRAELRAAGVENPFQEHSERPIAEHLRDFETTLKGRGVVPQYVKDRVGCLRAYFEKTGVRTTADLDLARASGFLTGLREPPRSLSPRSVNRHYQALHQFGRWLVETRRIAYNLFDALRPLNEKEGRRRVRRSLTPEEATRLMQAARTRPLRMAMAERVRSGVTEPERDRLLALGEARALIYLLALGTGLRRGELKRLRWADVDFDRALVNIPAASAKSRTDQTVELHPRLLEALRAAMPADADAKAPVVPSRYHPTTRTFHADLVAAGIAQEERIQLAKPNKKGETFKRKFDSRDASGRLVDFHALRTTFITWLGATGAHPRTAQALARHSSIEMTMQRYTDVRLLDLRSAINRLPLSAIHTNGASAATA